MDVVLDGADRLTSLGHIISESRSGYRMGHSCKSSAHRECKSMECDIARTAAGLLANPELQLRKRLFVYRPRWNGAHAGPWCLHARHEQQQRWAVRHSHSAIHRKRW